MVNWLKNKTKKTKYLTGVIVLLVILICAATRIFVYSGSTKKNQADTEKLSEENSKMIVSAADDAALINSQLHKMITGFSGDISDNTADSSNTDETSEENSGINARENTETASSDSGDVNNTGEDHGTSGSHGNSGKSGGNTAANAGSGIKEDTDGQDSGGKNNSANSSDTGTPKEDNAGNSQGSSSDNNQNQKKKITCRIKISCASILDNMDSLKPEKKQYVPSDGIILNTVTVTVNEHESVYEALRNACSSHGIALDSEYSARYKSAYIRGINNLYEKDCLSTSGWMYSVNGAYPGYGCALYELKNGDYIEWNYTCRPGDI